MEFIIFNSDKRLESVNKKRYIYLQVKTDVTKLKCNTVLYDNITITVIYITIL